MAALCGAGLVGTGSSHVYLTLPLILIKSLVPAGPGQEGRTKAGQRLQFQQLGTLHLGEQPVVKWEGKRNTESWGGLARGLPEQARAVVVS